ncbi:cation:proton antiporter [Anaerofustis stercorihominis]|uniref:cation:proton antiporter n=1 Tax=Anaerofustis stercorihominis TaxID=214853 RepID=UPI00214A9DD6|nr:cation:proton antiporter [Anaerofustis stercorihominis]MCR2033582.1 cation:proton antiporter [Anaerofustis stercorihominis]
MDELLTLGVFIACGFIASKICGKFRLPAVTGYLLAGLILGVSFFSVVPKNILTELNFLQDIALGFIAFNIGESFNIDKIKSLGSGVVLITIVQASVTIIVVTLGVFLATSDLPLSIVFGALSAATAPAATVNVIKQYKAKGKLTNTILTVVALDDAVCLFLFSIACAVSESMINGHFNLYSALISPLIEIVLSLGIGAVIGIAFCFVERKIRRDKSQVLIISCASVLVGTGLGIYFELSSILICMAVGSVIANYCSRYDRVFALTEEAVNPIYVIFFVLAGYSLDLKVVLSLGLIGIAFVVSRFIGKILGAFLGCEMARTDKVTRNYLGMGLMPMAGVGVGLAVAAARMMPDYGPLFLNIIMGATFIFEITGPILTAKGLKKSGDISIK